MRHGLHVLLAIACLGVGPAQAQDVTAGQTVFKKCMSCHDIGPDAKNRMGMVDAGAGGLVWNGQTLDAFLASPRDYVAGTKMTNISVKDATDRANLIAYLETLSPASVTPPAQ